LIGLGMIILAYFLLKTIGVNVVGGRVWRWKTRV
jgi:hypothetical protein